MFATRVARGQGGRRSTAVSASTASPDATRSRAVRLTSSRRATGSPELSRCCPACERGTRDLGGLRSNRTPHLAADHQTAQSLAGHVSPSSRVGAIVPLADCWRYLACIGLASLVSIGRTLAGSVESEGHADRRPATAFSCVRSTSGLEHCGTTLASIPASDNRATASNALVLSRGRSARADRV